MRHVVITGGASGIGGAVAARLARGGHRVTILDRQSSDSSSWWAGLPDSSRGAWVAVDVTDPDAVEAAIGEAAAVAPIDGLVTCAGVVARGSLVEQELHDFQRVISVNLMGTVHAVRATLRHVVDAQRPASIVTLASTAGLGYVTGLSAGYHVSKSGVIGLTRSVAGDFAKHGIRANVVAPGIVRTPMSQAEVSALSEAALAARAPAGRMIEAEEVASVIDWLLSPASRLTTGYVFPVDGGQSAVTGAPNDGYPIPLADTRDGAVVLMNEEV